MDERMKLTLADMPKWPERKVHRLEYETRRRYDDQRGFNFDSVYHVEKAQVLDSALVPTPDK